MDKIAVPQLDDSVAPGPGDDSSLIDLVAELLSTVRELANR
jgi:hypothetical protein